MNESISFNNSPYINPDIMSGQPTTESGYAVVESISDLDSIVSRLKVEKNDNTTVQLAYEAAKIMYPAKGQEEASKIESVSSLYKFAEILRTDDAKLLRSWIAEISKRTMGEDVLYTPEEAGLLIGLINQKTSKKYNN